MCEQSARKCLTQAAEEAVQQGESYTQVAEWLGLSGRTLRHWRRCTTPSQSARRGRPPSRSTLEVRQQVLSVMTAAGPNVGVPALRPVFPQVSRAELSRLLARYRKVCRRREADSESRLCWHHPGTVWAMDFVKAPEPIDGVAPSVLAVRDLSSGYQILWQAFPGETAVVVCQAVLRLFIKYGAPLVLKADNGSAFIAEVTAELLAEYRVTFLFSPARRPQYNGGCERGNGMLRTFTDEEARQDGRPGVWISGDLEQAEQLHNQVHRPERLRGRTPAEVWNARVPVTDEQRDKFQATVEAKRQATLAAWDRPPEKTLSRAGRRALDRIAARDALCELGYLTITRRRQRERALYRLLTLQREGAVTSSSAQAPAATLTSAPAADTTVGTQPSRVHQFPPPRDFAPPSAPDHNAANSNACPGNFSARAHPGGILLSETPSSRFAVDPARVPTAALSGCGFIHHLRRLFTLLLPRRKAAKIT